MTRVLVVDDHAVVRRGLVEILQEQSGPMRVVEASTAAAALAAAKLAVAKRKPFDVVVLDLTLPDRNGLEVLADLRRLCPGLPVLLLSMHPEDQFAVRAMKAGAAGYITKESASTELIHAVRRVIGGEGYVSAALGRRLAGSSASGAPHERLSARELAVFVRLAEGRRLKDIAGELTLSVKTVSTYRRRVLEKLGARTNAQLTLHALDAGLILR
jgi:two-component system, NarL family, invasion response regulator UvrY